MSADPGLVHVIEELARDDDHKILGRMLAGLLADPQPGATVTVDWCAFLGRSETDCINALTNYYMTIAGGVQRQVSRSGYLSRKMLQRSGNWLGSETGAHTWAEQKAAAHWHELKSS